MKVKAKRMGVYERRRRIGDVFEIGGPLDLRDWMEPLDEGVSTSTRQESFTLKDVGDVKPKTFTDAVQNPAKAPKKTTPV